MSTGRLLQMTLVSDYAISNVTFTCTHIIAITRSLFTTFIDHVFTMSAYWAWLGHSRIYHPVYLDRVSEGPWAVQGGGGVQGGGACNGHATLI